MSQQLVKKGADGRYDKVMPKSWIEAIKEKNTGQTLVEILQGFNMYFLPYNGNTPSTRNMVPNNLRKKGLWITYVKYDGNVHTEWYAADEIDDESWGDSSNWRSGNNTLVGDITISANGNWVINGTETEFKAVGEKGNTPLLRVANNRLQVSYDLGDTYIDVTNNPVYTKFRWLATTGDTQANNVGRIQASTDEGKTWTNMSNDFTNNLHIKKYIGVNESLPTSGIAEGTIYAKGPYYAEDDTLNDNPIYRLWVYAWKGNTLAWQDNGEFQSIAAGVVQETGDSETQVMSQKVVTDKFSELASEVRVFKESSNRNELLLKAGILKATKEVSLSIEKEDGYEYFIYFGEIINNGIKESSTARLYRQKEGGTLESIYNLRPNLSTPTYARIYSKESVGFLVLDLTKLDGSATDVSISRNSGFNLSDRCFGNILSSFYDKTNKIEDIENNIKHADDLLKGLNGEASANDDFSNKQYPWTPGSISTDGSFITYSSGEAYMRTDYILIKDIQKIYLEKIYVNQYISPIAFYSEDKKFISAPLNSTTTQTGIKAEIDVPKNAFYVAFTSKQDDKAIINFNSGVSLLSMVNRTRIENALNAIDNLEEGVILKEKVDESSVISSLNAYAYGSDGKFFANQHTGGYYYYLFKLAPNTRYIVKQKEIIENSTMMAGFLESESQFVVGGIATSFIRGGQVGEVNIDAAETERLFVLLGKKADNVYGYSELYGYTKNLEDSIEEIEESIKDLEDSIKFIDTPKLCCPDTLYAVVGKEFNIYYDSLIKGLDVGLNSPSDIYIDVQCPTLQTASANIGVRRERMWQIQQGKLTLSYVGEHSLQITAYDNKGNQIDRKIVKLLVSDNSSLASKKNILCIGDSLTNNGPIVATCAEHFNASGGVQPNFIGQRTTYEYKHEGYPGYSFSSFISSQAGYTYKIFDVPNNSNVAIEDKYSTNGTVYIVKDIRVEGLDNALRLRCEKYSGSNEPTQTGVLTKVSGQSSSDASIEYLAFEAESGNPFWDNETNSVNFTKYREKMGMGNNKFDIVVIMLGTNDCIGNIKDSMQGSISNAKTLINAILADAADYTTKIVLQITPADANTISSWQVYADSNGSGKKIGYWNNLWNLRHLMYDEFTKEEWKGKVYLGQAALGLDRYYGYPYTEVESSARISNVKEVYHTNSVHPNKEGYQQLGDGYYLQIKGLL